MGISSVWLALLCFVAELLIIIPLFLLASHRNHNTLILQAHFRTKRYNLSSVWCYHQWWPNRKVNSRLWSSVTEWDQFHTKLNCRRLVFCFCCRCFPHSVIFCRVIPALFTCIGFLSIDRMTLRLLIPGVALLCTLLSRSVTWSRCESSSGTTLRWLKKMPAIGQVSYSVVQWTLT